MPKKLTDIRKSLPLLNPRFKVALIKLNSLSDKALRFRPGNKSCLSSILTDFCDFCLVSVIWQRPKMFYDIARLIFLSCKILEDKKLGLSWAKLSSSWDLTLLCFFENLFSLNPALEWRKIIQWSPLWIIFNGKIKIAHILPEQSVHRGNHFLRTWPLLNGALD